MWLVTYSDGTTETFSDMTLELLAASVDDHKRVIRIEALNE